MDGPADSRPPAAGTRRENASAEGEDLDWERGIRSVGDAEMLSTLLDEMVATWSTGATRVERAFQDGGALKAAAVAHALWGVAATLGATRVRNCAARLEVLLGAGETSGFRDEIAKLADALQRFAGAVERAKRAGA